ncbi:MAG: SDR family NAD(P)-dependent oxidoreductase [Myxococcota bacterium]
MSVPASEQPFRLVIDRPGVLDSLTLRPLDPPTPGPGEVAISVHHAALNFRDVMVAMGFFSSGVEQGLGGECTGEIVALGPDVTDRHVGQVVVALAPFSLGHTVTTWAAWTAPIPAGLGSAEAAGLPTVFATAWHALIDIARLSSGQSILIHSAAGGTGLAAVQLAQRAGATVFATAGTPEKRKFLRELGIAHVMDSRSLDFADEILTLTDGRGVDVVLNSLAGQALDKSLSVVADDGHFIELGKRDIYADRPLNLGLFKRRLTYTAIDLEGWARNRPERLAGLFAQVIQAAQDGQIRPVPTTVAPISQIAETFRNMAQGHHCGKLVADLQDPSAQVRVPAQSYAIVADATYLITGGLGGLGLGLAAWLIDQGAQHLILLSRGGAATAVQASGLAELRTTGAEVLVAQADVADRDQLENVIAAIDADVPLRGVFHCAMVLDDGLALDQTPARLRAVMAPKVAGAWNLHELTANCPLDHFVMYSSAASLLGSPGQSGYCAGNAFLDALAHARRAEGRCALAINWGPFAEAGAAATAHRGERLANRGVPSLTPDEGLSILGRLLVSDVTQVGALRLDLRQWLEFFPHLAGSPLFAELAQGTGKTSSVADANLLAQLRGESAAQRSARLTDYVCSQVALVLRMDLDAVDPATPLKDLGIDSLMGLELRNRLEAALGLTLSATLIWTQPNINSLADYLTKVVSDTFDTTNDASVDRGVRRASSPAQPKTPPGPTYTVTQSAPALAKTPPASVKAPVDTAPMDDALAIVGLGCRYPGGATSPDAFWQLLDEGRDAIGRAPTDRWPADQSLDLVPGSQAWGGFLDQVDQFDPEFFGITPREAISLDPQQRLLLEVAWEALEDACIVPRTLRGTRTGVFVGICTADYQHHLAAAAHNDGYTVTGSASSFAAGRLSYTLGLQGPSLIVDTACSSSLVALHLAARSLATQESHVAIVGGVNLILSLRTTAGLAQTQALSADGRCKAFDARANGFVRSEGCGVLVLKPLAAAQRDGNTIHAIFRGSAMNQDGRSTGLTAPNVGAQTALIREALENARIHPDVVDYVEAHGTGTALGDPIEIEALKTVFGPRTDSAPCVLGTVKTNIGHTEAAAGLAGIIKTVLALKHQKIPKHLHFQQLNPRIGFDNTPFVLPTDARPWPAGDRQRIAGVSSFGLSGTNAHVILQEAPASAPHPKPTSTRPLHLLTLSGHCREALAAQCVRTADYLDDHPEAALLDVCHTAAAARFHHPHRLAVVAQDAAQLAANLRNHAAGQSTATAIQSIAASRAPKVGFVFSGQGAQAAQMGHQLYQSHPTFRDVIDRCSNAVADILDRDLRDVLADSDRVALDQTAYTQPALFAVQMGLAALWQQWGVTPSVVLGHSVGEFAAACVAGVFDLETGARLIAQRGRLMQDTPEGAMLALRVDEARAAKLIAQLAPPESAALSIAALNGPQATVVAGTPSAISTLHALCERTGTEAQRLRVTRAFHSALMETAQAAFAHTAQAADFQPPQMPFIGNIDGALRDTVDAAYWAQQLRAPVRFAAGVSTLAETHVDVLVEIGPHPALLGLIADQFATHGNRLPKLLPSLRRQQPDWATLIRAVGQLHVAGAAIDWAAFDQPYGAENVSLPTYPFVRRRLWVEASTASTPPQNGATDHPLLEHQRPLTGETTVLEKLVIPCWRKKSLPAAGTATAQLGRWLIVGDGAHAQAIAEHAVFGGKAVQTTAEAAGQHLGQNGTHVPIAGIVCIADPTENTAGLLKPALTFVHTLLRARHPCAAALGHLWRARRSRRGPIREYER